MLEVDVGNRIAEFVVVGSERIKPEARTKRRVVHNGSNIGVTVKAVEARIGHKADDGIFRWKEIGTYTYRVSLKRHPRIIVLVIRTFEHTSLKKVTVDD